MADKYLAKQEKLRQKEKAKFEKERAKWQKAEARKRKKKTRKVDVGALLFKVTAVVVAAAVVLGLGAYVAISFGYPGRAMPALRVAGKTIYQPEWAYMFYNAYIEEYNNAEYIYNYYGQAFGIGLTESLFEQKVTGEDGNEVPWSDKLQQTTAERLQLLYASAAAAKELGVPLSEEAQKELDEQIAEIEAIATKEYLSFNAYMRLTGNPPGLNKRVYQAMAERQAYADALKEYKNEEFGKAYTDEVLAAKYKEDTTAYDYLNLRIYDFAKTSIEAQEGESEADLAQRQEAANRGVKKEATDFLDKVSDETSFVAAATEHYGSDADGRTLGLRMRKSTLDSYYYLDLEEEHEEPEDDEEHVHEQDLLSDWAFAKDRKEGDKIVFEANSNFYAVYVTRAPYQVNTVDFYTINVAYETADDEETTAANQEEARTNAYAILSDWESADSSEEAFIAQINEHSSAAEEDGDVVEAALSSGISPGNTGYTELDNWLFDASRNAGQAAVIPVSGSYKVVYLKSQNKDDFSWKGEIKANGVNEDYNAYVEELREKYPYTEKAAGIRYGLKTAQPLCDAYMLYKQSEKESQGES